MPLPTRKLGDSAVTSLGLGLWSLSGAYGDIDMRDETRFTLLDAALAAGCTFWDTADVYGDSEDLLGKWFRRTGKRNEIFLATKFGMSSMAVGSNRIVNGDPEYVKSAVERSLNRLGVKSIDLYYLHRADPTVPIERTVTAMAELVKAGKIKYLGLSEVSASTLRRAHAIHPITAMQVEYSPFCLGIEEEKVGVLKACRELGVTIVAYGALGRGLLTGRVKSTSDYGDNDFRKRVERLNDKNIPNILKITEELTKIGQRHGATPGQVALAWCLAQGLDFIPIPGTSNLKYLEENLSALKIKLTPEELLEVRTAAEKSNASQGARTIPEFLQLVLADTPTISVDEICDESSTVHLPIINVIKSRYHENHRGRIHASRVRL